MSREPAPPVCALCGYDLTGSGGSRCPECGATIVAATRSRRPGRLLCAGVVALVMYAPYVWILFQIGRSDAGYVRSWLGMWPGLPALAIALPARRLGDGPWLAIMIVISVALLGGLTALARRGRRWFIVIVAFALAASCVQSWIAYGLFRM